jgi:hypothetical protein
MSNWHAGWLQHWSQEIDSGDRDVPNLWALGL